MKIDVLGVKVNADTKNTILFLIKKLLGENRRVFIVTPYSETIVKAQIDDEFKGVLNSADFSLPDGIGVVWAAHFLKRFMIYDLGFRKIFGLISTLKSIILNPKSIYDPIPEKISGSEFVWDLARLAAERGYSVFLLGGFGDTPRLAAANLKSKFPNLNIAGTANEIPETINADFLFVALGPVRQEKWIAANISRLPIKLAIGLGGTFDYLAGKRAPAPHFWAVRGLEWLWRLLTQPWRLWRISKGIPGLIYHAFKVKIQ